jgi:hypothetical protein
MRGAAMLAQPALMSKWMSNDGRTVPNLAALGHPMVPYRPRRRAIDDTQHGRRGDASDLRGTATEGRATC